MSEIISGVFTNAFVTLGGLFLLSRALPMLQGRSRLVQQVCLGLMFGATVVAAMLNGFPITEGVYGDLRNGIIAVAALTTGPLATLICLAVAVAMRISMGGAVGGALLGLGLCTALSLAFRAMPVKKTPAALGAFGFFLALVNTVVPFSATLLGGGSLVTALPVAMPIFLCCAALYPVAIALVTTLMRHEIERLDEQASLLARNGELAISTKRFSDVFDLSCVPMAWVDLSTRRFLRVNREYERFTGYSADELGEMTIEELSPLEERESDLATLATLANGQKSSVNGEKPYRRKDGSISWGSRTLTATPDSNKLGLAIVEDVTEQRRAAQQIAFLAEHDPVTTLANRFFFGKQLEAILDHQLGQAVAVLIIDLDNFKAVNDTRGHAAGDRVLIHVAETLRALSRPDDVVARIGGDEFAVIRSNTSVRDALALAEALLSEVRRDVLLDGEGTAVAASIGIAMSSSPARDAMELVKKADIALYQAKAAGKGATRVFEPSMEREVVRREQVKADLARAVTASELELEYQPLVEIATRRITGFEALLRWNHHEKGRISPAEFIPVAEESHTIIEIGNWVLQTACCEATKWPSDIRVAVNVSVRQFEPSLPLRIAAALASSGLAASRLQIEITESVMMDGSSANEAILQQVRQLGVSIALDDFGTGYSSLSYLQRFPFAKLKIDKSFVSGVGASDGGRAIAASIVQLGHSLGMIVTAEGIETEEQLQWMKLGGCDEAQGYLFSRSVQACDVLSVLGQGTSSPSAGRRLTA